MGSQFPDCGLNLCPYLARQILNHWIPREVPVTLFLKPPLAESPGQLDGGGTEGELAPRKPGVAHGFLFSCSSPWLLENPGLSLGGNQVNQVAPHVELFLRRLRPWRNREVRVSRIWEAGLLGWGWEQGGRGWSPLTG